MMTVHPKLLINGMLTQSHRPIGIPVGYNFMTDEVAFYFRYQMSGLDLHGEVAHGEFLGDEIWAITLRHPDGTEAGSPGVVGSTEQDAIDWLCGPAFQVALGELA